MNDSKNSNITLSFIKSEPLTNHFERPLGLSHTYEEIDSLIGQFDRCDELAAREIKKLLSVTLKFLAETESSTKSLRAENPNSKNIIEKAIKNYKQVVEQINTQTSGIDSNAQPILQKALTYSRDAIDKRLTKLKNNSDPIYPYANTAFTDFFKKHEGTYFTRRV